MDEKPESSKEEHENKPRRIEFARVDAKNETFIDHVVTEGRDDAPAPVKPVSENPFPNQRKPSEHEQPPPKKSDDNDKK